MKHFHILLFISTLVLSCTQENAPIVEGPVYNVDPEFEVYVQEFIAEGAKRGHNIDFSDSGLRIQFSELALDGAAGLCRLGRYDIEIDKANWFQFSERFRAYLLFHELGHCELDRLHRNDKFGDNTWKSILRGDPFTGIENRFPVAYFGFRKDYYLDELFDEGTPAPDWSKVDFKYDEFLDRTEIASAADISRLNEPISDITGDYEFEVSFDLIADPSIRTRLEWGLRGENYFVYIIPDWGYYVGINAEGNDNFLYYSRNINFANDRPIDRITIRRDEGVEKVFVNEEFVFHLDQQQRLDYIQLNAMEGEQINNDLVIDKFVLSSI